MNKTLFSILFILFFSACEDTHKTIYVQNSFTREDSVNLVIGVNEDIIYRDYIPVSSSSKSYSKILLNNNINSAELTHISVELPDWGIQDSKTANNKDFNTVIISIAATVDKKLLNERMSELELDAIKDSLLVPKVSIAFRINKK